MPARKNEVAVARRTAKFVQLLDAMGEGAQKRLAAITGVKATYVRDLSNGRGGWSDKRMSDIEAIFSAPRGFFDDPAPVKRPDFALATRADLQAWLGGSSPAQRVQATEVPWVRIGDVMDFMSKKMIAKRLMIRDTTLPASIALLAVVCPADCPEPLTEGDLAIFALGGEPLAGTPVLAYVPAHGTTIRRYQARGAGRYGYKAFELASTSGDHPSFTIKAPEDGQLIGVLVQMRRSFAIAG